MLSFFKKLFLPILSFLLYAQNAMATGIADAFVKAKNVAGAGSYATTTKATLNNTISNLITTVLSLLGIIFVILSIYGGFLYLTARGNQEQSKKAISIIKQALIGLIIVLSAYAISYFIFKFFV
jgi:hypothetical protein